MNIILVVNIVDLDVVNYAKDHDLTKLADVPDKLRENIASAVKAACLLYTRMPVDVQITYLD